MGIRNYIGYLLHCYVAYVNMVFIRYSLVVLKVTECSYVFLCGIFNFQNYLIKNYMVNAR